MKKVKDIKVVIIGQDPYYREGQANGLCFSVEEGIKIPPSLKNIFKEIYGNDKIPNDGNLEYLAKQGVLLLNKTLTVEEGKPNSHLKIWKGFMEDILKYINMEVEGVVYLLWGNKAKKLKKYIDINKNYILEATHPSPLGANKGGWFGTEHFTKCNTYLLSKNKESIIWKK